MADNNPQLQSVDRFQKAYIEQEKYHEKKVRTIRVMILVLFLALWELCTRLDMVDDFIFSSPSRVFFCFRKMVLDGSIFSHIGITLFETIVSFLIVTIIGISGSSPAVVQPECIGNPGAVSGDAKQPSKVRSGSYADRVDGKSCAYHHRGGGFRSCVRLNPDAAVRIFLYGSGSDPVDLYSWRNEEGCAHKGIIAWLCAFDLEQYEGQCGTVSGGGDHRRIPGGKERTWLSYYLWQPGFSAGLCRVIHRASVPFSSLFYRMIAGRE